MLQLLFIAIVVVGYVVDVDFFWGGGHGKHPPYSEVGTLNLFRLWLIHRQAR